MKKEKRCSVGDLGTTSSSTSNETRGGGKRSIPLLFQDHVSMSSTHPHPLPLLFHTPFLFLDYYYLTKSNYF